MPNRCSTRWPRNPTRTRAGWWCRPAPAARQPLLAATCAFAALAAAQASCAWSIPKTPCLPTAMKPATAASPPPKAHASKALAARASNPALSPPSSIAWSACPTPPPALRYLETGLGRRCGGSTGTNLIGVVRLLAEMRQRNERGSIVTLICDGGERYADTYYNDDWLAAENIDIQPWLQALERWDQTGEWQEPA